MRDQKLHNQRRPAWLRKKIEFEAARPTNGLLKSLGLNTVCREAGCPNISECFKNNHATFLILGKNCTRHCAFCRVTKATPERLDKDEPERIASAVKKMRLAHVVITGVTRDDLPDAGATAFAKTVTAVQRLCPTTSIELLIPDCRGDEVALRIITASRPAVIGHNMETVKRLYLLRPQADYQRSLTVLKKIKTLERGLFTKSALMLGLGETQKEVHKVMQDLRAVDCDFLALGQYLKPSGANTDVREYVTPEQFDRYKEEALSLGFKHVESGPYVRSSYRAGQYTKEAHAKNS